MRTLYVFLDFLGFGTAVAAGLYWYDNRPMSLISLGAVIAALLTRAAIRPIL